MQIDEDVFHNTRVEDPLKSLDNLKPNELLAAIHRNHQGPMHRNTVTEMARSGVDAEILQQNHDYAVLRTINPNWSEQPAHWLCGYSDGRGLFIHNVPSGVIDYCSEPMWYILAYVNKREAGFHRVQGDLLIRNITEGWEIEELRELEKEFGMLLINRNISIGNRHMIDGRVSEVTANDKRTDEKALIKRERTERTRIRHDEHNDLEKVAPKTEYDEVSMQERGEEQPFGGGGD